jgi:hypothetical protein
VSCKSKRDKGIDGIKRLILKNDIGEGGLNIIEVEWINKSLKHKQFIRANRSKPTIKMIQCYCVMQC